MMITFLFEVGPSLGNIITNLGVQLVATLADFSAKIDALKVQADAILVKIQDLEAKISGGGLTADEEAAALAQLDDLKTHLDAAQNA